MIDRKHWMTPAALGLMTLAMLMSLLVGWRDVAASPTAQEAAAGGLWDMGIGARTEGAEHPGHTYGARFIVTSEDGDYIGECTLESIETTVPWHNCRVDVPSDRISLVWEDLESIPAGYAPVENPIVFDPATYGTGPHNIGAFFHNVLISGSGDNVGNDSFIAALVATLIRILQMILGSRGR